MTMVIGVPGALLSAGRAQPDAGPQQVVNDELVPLGGSRNDTRRDIAHIRAIQAERDAGTQLVDVLLGEICVGVRNARLGTVQAGVDSRCDFRDTERHLSRRGIQHFSGGRHACYLLDLAPVGRDTITRLSVLGSSASKCNAAAAEASA
jgi:hypothetical protein